MYFDLGIIITCCSSADPFYVTFDGKEFPFKGGCRYEFFSCGDIRMWADHVKTDSSAEKTETSAETRAIEVNIVLSYVLIVYLYSLDL